jgi:hypothetical protein
MKRKDLYNYIKEEIVNTLSEESVAWSSDTKSKAKIQIDKSKLSGDAKKQAKDEIDQNASGLISNVSESDLDEARKAGGYRIGDASKFAEAKELYSKGLYADVLNAIESAGEDGITQKDLGIKLGKNDSTSLNPILVKFKEIGVFGGGKLAKAEKPEAGEEVDDSAPEEFDSFYATDIEDEMPEEEPTTVASDKEIEKLAGDVSTGKTEEINKAINIVKNLSTKIQGMKKGPDREKKVAALKQYINNNKNLLKGRDINTLTNGLIG